MQMHVIFCRHMKIAVAMVTEIIKLLRKHGSLDDSITIQASLMKLGL